MDRTKLLSSTSPCTAAVGAAVVEAVGGGAGDALLSCPCPLITSPVDNASTPHHCRAVSLVVPVQTLITAVQIVVLEYLSHSAHTITSIHFQLIGIIACAHHDVDT